MLSTTILPTVRSSLRQRTLRVASMQMAYYTEGAVPSAGGKFKEKENALENQYMRQQDALKLKKLQEQLEAAQQSVDSVKKELQEHVEKNNKN